MTTADLDTLNLLRQERARLFAVQEAAWKTYSEALRTQGALDRAIDRILEEDAAVTTADATNESEEAAA